MYSIFDEGFEDNYDKSYDSYDESYEDDYDDDLIQEALEVMEEEGYEYPIQEFSSIFHDESTIMLREYNANVAMNSQERLNNEKRTHRHDYKSKSLNDPEIVRKNSGGKNGWDEKASGLLNKKDYTKYTTKDAAKRIIDRAKEKARNNGEDYVFDKENPRYNDDDFRYKEKRKKYLKSASKNLDSTVRDGHNRRNRALKDAREKAQFVNGTVPGNNSNDRKRERNKAKNQPKKKAFKTAENFL